MPYKTDHAAALAAIKDAGSAVTFTKVTKTYDGATDTMTSASSTIAGFAVKVSGDVKRYEVLGLIESNAPTLLFAPTTFGDEPELGSTVTWSGSVHTVRDVQPVAPDGTLVTARIVVSR